MEFFVRSWFTRGSWNQVARFGILDLDSPKNVKSRHFISFQFARSIDMARFDIFGLSRSKMSNLATPFSL